jgi:hypothetical protein
MLENHEAGETANGKVDVDNRYSHYDTGFNTLDEKPIR